MLRDRAQHAGHSLLLAPDTTTWTEGETGRQLAVPTAGIAEVHVRDRGRTVRRSVGTGALIGGGVGLALGVSLVPVVGTSLVALSTASTAAVGALYGAVGGATDRRPGRYVLAPIDGQAAGGAFEVPRPAPVVTPAAPASGPLDGP